MGKWGIALSLFVTFAISGLWHGANWTFVIFGSLHGLALIYEFLTKRTRRKWSEIVPAPIYNTVSIVLVFAFASFAWIFFRSPSFTVAGQILGNIGFGNAKRIFEAMHTPDLIISVCGIILLELINLTYRKTDIDLYLRNRPVWLRYAMYYVGILIITQVGVFSNQQFIYFQF
jgi:D-alanyl-lipoteichoic acid acyltransferase DltB (MBOAT superfamily)